MEIEDLVHEAELIGEQTKKGDFFGRAHRF
jgi:hypothetical protein